MLNSENKSFFFSIHRSLFIQRYISSLIGATSNYTYLSNSGWHVYKCQDDRKVLSINILAKIIIYIINTLNYK